MKNILLPLLICFLLLTGSCGPQKHNTNSSVPIPNLQVQDVADMTYLYMDVLGSYSQHPAFISKIQGYLIENNIKSGRSIGIYFEDPNAVDESGLSWQIGFEIFQDINELDYPFKIRKVISGKALVTESKVWHLGSHGIYSEVWMLEHGWVQTSPSRTMYHLDSQDPLAASSTIVYPVNRRSRDTPVITKSTL